MTTAADVQMLALALDGVEEKAHFGSASFRRGGRIFIHANDKTGDAICKLSPAHQEILFETRPETFRPEIWGRLRWTRLVLAGVARDELQALVREAYDQVAAARKSAKPRVSARKRTS